MVVFQRFAEARANHHQNIREFFAARKIQYSYRRRLSRFDTDDYTPVKRPQPRGVANNLECMVKWTNVFMVGRVMHKNFEKQAKNLLLEFLNKNQMIEDVNDLCDGFYRRRLALVK